MTRLILLLLFSFPILRADQYKLQLQNIIITPTDNITGVLTCQDIQSITFDEFPITLTTENCYGSGVTNASGNVVFIPVNNNATFDNKKVMSWEIELSHINPSSSSKIFINPTEISTTEAATITGATTRSGQVAAAKPAWTQKLSGNLSTPTEDTNVTLVTDKSGPITGLKNKMFTLTFSLMRIHTSTETVNNNTQAVVVAVIEGLLLGAILVVFIYRQFFSKKRQQQRPQRTGGGFQDPTVGGNSFGAAGGNYYDNAAVAYRQNNASQNPSYGYDQPSIRLEERRPASQAAADTGRVQVDSPSLVPVPLGSNPLAQSQWGDNRNGTAPDRLFT